jgi:hypothetical protein
MPVRGADGWCTRCDVHSDDHGDDIFVFPRAFLKGEVDHLHGALYRSRMRDGVDPIPVSEYRGTGSKWQYGAAGQ